MILYSVTQVLAPYFNVGGRIPGRHIEGGIIRGNEVHRYCLATASKEWAFPPAEYGGYCDSFLWWFFNEVEEILAVEPRLEDPINGYFGHPDLIVRRKGCQYPSITDLKTPAGKSVLWRLQIAAYDHLAQINGYPDLDVGGSLRLKEDGSPAKFDCYDFKHGDLAAFLSALNTWRYING